jgi:hypothetical protein
MKRQDQRAGFADEQPRAHVHADLLEPLDLDQQVRGSTTTPLPM